MLFYINQIKLIIFSFLKKEIKDKNYQPIDLIKPKKGASFFQKTKLISLVGLSACLSFCLLIRLKN